MHVDRNGMCVPGSQLHQFFCVIVCACVFAYGLSANRISVEYSILRDENTISLITPLVMCRHQLECVVQQQGGHVEHLM